MDRDELRSRTKKFALRIIRLVSSLPRDKTGDVLGRQILNTVNPELLTDLIDECNQLVAILAATVKTYRQN